MTYGLLPGRVDNFGLAIQSAVRHLVPFLLIGIQVRRQLSMLWVKPDVKCCLHSKLSCRHMHGPRGQRVGTFLRYANLVVALDYNSFRSSETLLLHLFPPALQPRSQNHLKRFTGLEIHIKFGSTGCFFLVKFYTSRVLYCILTGACDNPGSPFGVTPQHKVTT